MKKSFIIGVLIILVLSNTTLLAQKENQVEGMDFSFPSRSLQLNLSLSNAPIGSFIGEDSGDLSGYSVTDVGDVNGDGLGDILIGAPENEIGGVRFGQTYLILGKESGWSLDLSLSEASASFYGENSDDYSGYSLSGVGDVNNDGFDDFIIGAMGNDDGGSNAGKTYLIMGKSIGWSMYTDLSTADASFIGEDESDVAGYAVSGAGDVNGDGYDDILIGAYSDEEGGEYAGQTYLIFGKGSGWSKNFDLSNADASFIGEGADDCSGYSISGVDDVNNDGFDDILIGAWGNGVGGSHNGQSYLIFGKESGWSMDTNLSKADASFIGENEGDWSGFSVSGVGDVNGDGFSDILIGAYPNDESYNTAGQTYLIFGKNNGWSMDSSLSTSDASFLGENIGDSSGASISGAGDVNSDGYDDILIGAYRSSEGGDYAGQTYLIFGKPSGWTMDIILSESDASFIGEETEDQAGISVSGAGDVDGDGYDDILIGANTNDEGGNSAGQTYLISFNKNNPPKITSIPKTSVNQGEQYFMNFSAIDPDGDIINEWRITTNAPFLSFQDNSGMLYGEPSNEDVGFYFINVTAEDSGGLYDWINYTLSVLNVNDKPEILNLEIADVFEDVHFFFDHEAIDIDPTNDILLWDMNTFAQFITLDTSTGNITGIPSNNDVGTWWVNLTVRDGNGGIDLRNFTFTVLNTNDCPVINRSDVSYTMEEDSTGVTFDLNDLFNDIDGDILSFEYIGSPTNLTISLGDGIVKAIPKSNWFGTEVIEFISTDGFLSVSLNVTFKVTSVNDAPYDIQIISEISYFEEGDQLVNSTASDVDIPFGDELFFKWNSNITGEIGNGKSLNLSLPAGHHMVTLTVNDIEGLSANATIEIQIIPVVIDDAIDDDVVDDDIVDQNDTTTKEKKFPIIVLIIVGAVIMLIIISLVLFFLLRKKSSEEEILVENERNDFEQIEDTILQGEIHTPEQELTIVPRQELNNGSGEIPTENNSDVNNYESAKLD